MDIMMPDIHEQAAPAPWLALRGSIDGRRLVAEIVENQPKAALEDVAAELRRRNCELPMEVVADLMQQRD